MRPLEESSLRGSDTGHLAYSSREAVIKSLGNAAPRHNKLGIKTRSRATNKVELNLRRRPAPGKSVFIMMALDIFEIKYKFKLYEYYFT